LLKAEKNKQLLSDNLDLMLLLKAMRHSNFYMQKIGKVLTKQWKMWTFYVLSQYPYNMAYMVLCT